MSDEQRDDEDGFEDYYNAQREGESEGEWLRRVSSPELRMLDLFERLTARVEKDEEEAKRRDERVQGRIEFILQQQAQFNVDMQRLRETQENSERRWERTEESVRSLHAIALIHEGEITALAERQSEVGERVNALVNTVEQLISERRNGGRGEENSG